MSALLAEVVVVTHFSRMTAARELAVTSNPNRCWLGIAEAARQTACLPCTPIHAGGTRPQLAGSSRPTPAGFSAYFRCLGHWSGFFAWQANHFTAVGSL